MSPYIESLINILNQNFQELVNYLRVHSDAQSYAASMSAPVCQQIITSLSVISGRYANNNEGKQSVFKNTLLLLAVN